MVETSYFQMMLLELHDTIAKRMHNFHGREEKLACNASKYLHRMYRQTLRDKRDTAIEQ
jgi:hypothetical protein